MEDILTRKNPWNSLPSVLSHIHVTSSSFRRGSSCASDDISDISTVTTATTATNVSSSALPEFGIPIPQTPKQHFCLESIQSHNVNGYESGFESDGLEIETPEHVEISDHVRQYLDSQFQEDDDIFDFEGHPTVSHDEDIDADVALYEDPEHESEVEDFEIDLGDNREVPETEDAHVAFVTSVRFDDKNITYIEPYSSEDDEPQMTAHERMLLALKDLPQAEDITNGKHDDKTANLNIVQLSRDHPREMVNIDKQIFVAFINGIHGATEQKYQPHLRDRVEGFRKGRFKSPFFDNYDDCEFLDNGLKHVIGVFRNVVSREEFEELGHLARQRSVESQPEGEANLLEKIEHLVSERLLEGGTSANHLELQFFADGVFYALKRPHIYAYDVDAEQASP